MNFVGRNAILALIEETSGYQPFGERRDRVPTITENYFLFVVYLRQCLNPQSASCYCARKSSVNRYPDVLIRKKHSGKPDFA